ncbi:MAG: adenylate/guanylate cyclase domain-containing protein [Leptospiraceae bacterium]|nr:adenylate/guanylate cyclase domain-containing protein [Leptospiraceae bacterium]
MHKIRFKLLIKLIILGMLSGSIISFIQSYAFSNEFFISILNGVVDGGLIATLIGVYHIYIREFSLKQNFQHINFVLRIFFHSSIYLILIIFGRSIGRYIMGEYSSIILFPVENKKDIEILLDSVSKGFIISIFINFILENNQLIGGKTFIKFLSGEYRIPKTEERVILFLDMVSSTSIAEKIGDLNFINLLKKFFQEMSEPILITKAEIHKYVGDEVILTWSERQKNFVEESINFSFLFQEKLEKEKARFLKEFGIFPEFRTAIHFGSIAIGEIGELKKEIAFMGDSLNTTARILDHGKKYDTKNSVLISESALNKLTHREKYNITTLGDIQLKGKEIKIQVFQIDRINNT